ncbi:hypothetical protein QUF76_04685 [Desulfobacterales bacterium HSG16]|nr:hypothetical protein [Desulfobacterales bacterium HSG16]
MNTENYQTVYEIQKTAFLVLQKNLGVTNLIRFMQQFDKGYGNYTTDRDEWQKEYTVDKLFKQIKKKNE